MTQGTIGYANPAKPTGFLSLTALAEWFIEHIEITVFILCIIGYQYYEYQRQQNAAAIVQNPQKYDFMFVDYFVLDKASDPRHRFVPLKVMSVDQQNVTFKIGNIAHSTAVSPSQHMKFDSAMQRNFYRAYPLSLNKDTIASLYNSGVIYDARRPRNIFIDGWVVLTLAELNSDK
jgi:hypothetical protein